MYIEEFILVEYLDTLLYMDELNMHRKCSSLYTMQQKDEIALRCTIDTVEWIELQWSENLST